MTQVRITNIVGETLPVNVYISDVYGNNSTLLGVINSSVPPTITYNSTIPPIFNTAPEIKLTLIDAKNCEVFKILDCTFGCAFEVIIELESCVVNIDIQNSSCVFGVSLADPSCFINDLNLSDPSCFINDLNLSDPSCFINN